MRLQRSDARRERAFMALIEEASLRDRIGVKTLKPSLVDAQGVAGAERI